MSLYLKLEAEIEAQVGIYSLHFGGQWKPKSEEYGMPTYLEP
jgi:hypothetical protein